MSKSDTIWRRLGKRGKGVWWLPVVTAVLGALLSLAINSVRPVVYEGSTRVAVVHPCDRTPSNAYVSCPTSRLYQAILWIVYDREIRQLGLPGEGYDLDSAIDVDIVGYNERVADWLDDQRSVNPFSRFVPTTPDLPPLTEIRVRNAEPATAFQISEMMVDAVNEMDQGSAETHVAEVVATMEPAVHDLNLQLVYLGENPRYEAERAALEARLDYLHTWYSSELQEFEAKQAAGFIVPLHPLEPSTIQKYPRRWLGLIIGTAAGLVVGLVVVMVRRYRVD
jgi:hypothetical protein